MRQHKHHVTIRRLLFVALLKGCLFILILGRLYVLQVLHADKYVMLSDDNRIRIQLILPHRGEIFDRRGHILASNVDNYSAILIPEDVQNMERTLAFLKDVLSLSEEDLRRIKKGMRQKPSFMPTVVKEELTWEHLSKIELHSLRFPGVSIVQGFKRHYTLGKSGAHVLGYVSSPNEAEVQGDKTLMLPGAKVGKSALESYYEDDLKGVAGQREVEVDAHGRVIRELNYTAPVPGKDLHLSIDQELQDYILKIFEEREVESGAAIVLDIHTGEILSMVSVPGFDPDLFYHGIDAKSWKGLLEDIYKPLTNKVIAGQYSPASIFKVIVALAALEQGHFLHETYMCPGYHKVGNHKFHCWKKAGHGRVNLYQALVRSCDVYFYNLARKLGEKPIIDMAKRFGLKTLTGVDLPNEVKGFLADPDWKKRVRKENWYLGDTVLTSIGQAYVLNTPIQMAVMMAQMANGGYKVTPRLLPAKKKISSQEEYLGIREESLLAVLKSIADAVNVPGGTSYRSRIANPNYAMGGKTGTAQVRRITMQERAKGVRKDKDIPWHLRDNALFVGFAPVHAPRYAIALVAEHKGFGGVAAAPVGGKVLERVQQIAKKEQSC